MCGFVLWSAVGGGGIDFVEEGLIVPVPVIESSAEIGRLCLYEDHHTLSPVGCLLLSGEWRQDRHPDRPRWSEAWRDHRTADVGRVSTGAGAFSPDWGASSALDESGIAEAVQANAFICQATGRSPRRKDTGIKGSPTSGRTAPCSTGRMCSSGSQALPSAASAAAARIGVGSNALDSCCSAVLDLPANRRTRNPAPPSTASNRPAAPTSGMSWRRRSNARCRGGIVFWEHRAFDVGASKKFQYRDAAMLARHA